MVTKKSKKTPNKPPASRRFTPYSFKSPIKRRRAEKTVSQTKTAGSFTIFGRAVKLLFSHWEVFGGLFLIFMLVNTILAATSLLSVDLSQAKFQLTDQGVDSISTSFALFEAMFSNGVGSATGGNGAYQMLLLILMSLATVWALRQLIAGNRVRVRDALYNSSYPLVQVLLVLLVMAVQLLPMALGLFLLNTLLIGGVIIVNWQQFLVGAAIFLLCAWTIYMLISSTVSLYIATLPEMTPLKALRSARDIVRFRRAMVLRKLLFLPFLLVLIGGLILVPLSFLFPSVAPFVFFGLSMAVVPIVHAYMYILYRELIQ